MGSVRTAAIVSAALLLEALPFAFAHKDHGMDTSHNPAAPTAYDGPPTYFRHPHQGGWMFTHVALMVMAWIFVLPVAIMLSVARSRYHLPAQLIFHIVNGLGLFTGFVYNHSTPDLYENNAHHPIGWVVTACTILWTLASHFVAFGDLKAKRTAAGSQSTPAGSVAQHDSYQPYIDSPSPRFSQDSGFGSRQNSSDSIHHHKPEAPEDELDDEEPERHGLLDSTRVDRFVSRNIGRFSSQRVSKAIRITHFATEKLFLPLGFATLATGFITYAGLFQSREVFSGAAHFVKGGIFFWYGLLTLARWMGAFAEFGWAWNLRPAHPVVARWKARVPSAEFTESFVIWLYGASNVFLEHLNKWGEAWSAQDLEHVSITVLFFGGGLLGMLVESRWVREALSVGVEVQRQRSEDEGAAAQDAWSRPATERVSLNPLPALVILLLGTMMSSHHQTSMVSTMLHAQWGTLFFAFALARGVTYATLYLKPPSTHYPSRPPSELVASFCLTAGGLMFMISARDTVKAIEGVGLDAMSVFTTMMGLAGVLMAWVVVVYCVKGWAVRRERKAEGGGREVVGRV